jgi:hypothetical protein
MSVSSTGDIRSEHRSITEESGSTFVWSLPWNKTRISSKVSLAFGCMTSIEEDAHCSIKNWTQMNELNTKTITRIFLPISYLNDAHSMNSLLTRNLQFYVLRLKYIYYTHVCNPTMCLTHSESSKDEGRDVCGCCWSQVPMGSCRKASLITNWCSGMLKPQMADIVASQLTCSKVASLQVPV